MNWWLKSQKGLYGSKLYWALSYFGFYNYCIFTITSTITLIGILIGITSSAIG